LPYSQRFSFDLAFPQRISKADLKIPDELMISSRKAQLGQILFNDKRLSANNTVSCASCHGDSNLSDSRQFSLGLNNNPLARHTPPLINRALTSTQMWDSKFSGLHTQVLGPVTNPNEMNLTSAQVLSRITSNPSYYAAFKNVYSQEPSLNNIQQAISSFLNSIMTENTSGADQFELFKDGLTVSQIRGRELFFGQARCSSCHSGVNFTDEQMHNIGIFGVTSDTGMMGVTGRAFDARYFKTPSLRNVAQTAPYMHDGRFSNLDQVVAQYNLGGLSDPNRSNEIKPLNLSAQQRADLVEYLKALTSPVKIIIPINNNPANTIEQLGAGL
jgi:cytochrome c peroxidase